MFVRSLIAVLLLAGVSLPILANEQMRSQYQEASKTKESTKSPVDEQEVSSRGLIYGAELMTPEDLHLFRSKMISLKTRDVMEQFLREHHDIMDERAKAQGITLQGVPPKRINKLAAGKKEPAQSNIMGPLGW